jgi:hypothetical protein
VTHHSLPHDHCRRLKNLFSAPLSYSRKFEQVTSIDDRFQEKLRSVVEYLQFRDVPAELKRKVKRHYTTCWRKSAVPYAELQVARATAMPTVSRPSDGGSFGCVYIT